jgi:hypothetical protein
MRQDAIKNADSAPQRKNLGGFGTAPQCWLSIMDTHKQSQCVQTLLSQQYTGAGTLSKYTTPLHSFSHPGLFTVFLKGGSMHAEAHKPFTIATPIFLNHTKLPTGSEREKPRAGQGQALLIHH